MEQETESGTPPSEILEAQASREIANRYVKAARECGVEGAITGKPREFWSFNGQTVKLDNNQYAFRVDIGPAGSITRTNFFNTLEAIERKTR